MSSVVCQFIPEKSSDQLGPSEWCTLWWMIRYFIPDLLLAVYGGSMYDPPLLVSQVNPVYEFTNYTSGMHRRLSC